MSNRQLMIKAALDKYEAQKSEALANLEVIFTNSVGIGEHTDYLVEVDKWIEHLSQAEEKLQTLNEYFGEIK